MRQDIKSSYQVSEAIAAADLVNGTYNSVAVDHSLASSCGFLLSAGTVGGTVDAKSQYSADGSTWTDYPVDDEAKNDWAIDQLTAAGSAQLTVSNPRERYSRVVVVVAGGNANLSLTSVLGPLRHVK